jgi:hypothetical protein
MVSEKRGPVEVFWWQDAAANSALTPIELALHGVFQDRGLIPLTASWIFRLQILCPDNFPPLFGPEDAMQSGEDSFQQMWWFTAEA